MDFHTAARLAAVLAIGLGGIGPGIGIGIATMGAVQAIGRNPDAEGPIRTTLILGAGLAEAVAIYAFVVALVLLFVAGWSAARNGTSGSDVETTVMGARPALGSIRVGRRAPGGEAEDERIRH
jgi:F-type H+-transporting ATPase subunit c